MSRWFTIYGLFLHIWLSLDVVGQISTACGVLHFAGGRAEASEGSRSVQTVLLRLIEEHPQNLIQQHPRWKTQQPLGETGGGEGGDGRWKNSQEKNPQISQNVFYARWRWILWRVDEEVIHKTIMEIEFANKQLRRHDILGHVHKSRQ